MYMTLSVAITFKYNFRKNISFRYAVRGHRDEIFVLLNGFWPLRS